MLMDKPNPIGRVALGDVVTRSCRRTPDKTALISAETGESVTYREFNARVNQAAHAFRSTGLEKGDRVGFVTANSERMLAAEYGALKAGLVPSLNNVGVDPETLKYQLDKAEIKALIVDDVFYPKVKPYAEQANLSVMVVVEWEMNAPDEATSFESFIKGRSEAEVDVEIDGDDPALIMYTSGTTAKPKGVLHSHRSYAWLTTIVTMKKKLKRSDVTSQVFPMFHIAEATTRSALMSSATSILFRSYEPEACLEAIEEYDVTIFSLMSSMFRRLFTKCDVASYDLSSVRLCMYGMPMEMSMRDRIITEFDCELLCTLGQTEAGILVYFDPEWQLEKPGNYVGWSGPFTDVAIMDDDGDLLSAGETGEIVYRSPSIMEGYLDDEAKTEEVWRHDWHHTGDVGKFDEDGQLLFVDRKKDIIKTGGENVSSSKIQNVIGDHPGVAECVVVGLPHERWGEGVTAFIIPESSGSVSSEDIRTFAEDKLGEFERPKGIEFVDNLPQTETGKIRKIDVSQEYQDYYR